MNNKALIYILALCLVSILTGLSIQAYRQSTPDYALSQLIKGLEEPDFDRRGKYLTEKGRRAVQSNYARSILGRVQIASTKKLGNEHRFLTVSLVNVMYLDIPVSCDLVFIRNGWHWQFDDIHIKDAVIATNLVKVELPLSYIIDHPIKSGGVIIINNPGLSKGAVDTIWALIKLFASQSATTDERRQHEIPCAEALAEQASPCGFVGIPLCLFEFDPSIRRVQSYG